MKRKVPRSNGVTFETQSELNYGDSQHAFVSRNQRASSACVSIITTQREQTPLTRKEPKKKGKADFQLTCDPGTKGPPCVHTEEVQTEFMTALSLLLPQHLSTHQWTLAATTPAHTDRASLIHSPPRCLCQVIAGRKRKTDQYISHGPDR